MSVQSEKLAQAKRLVDSSGHGAWLTFVRETALAGDPVLPLILDGGLTWHSALIVFKGGKTCAVVGNYDADPLRASGDWDEVVPYVQGIRSELLGVLDENLAPGSTIAVNFSTDDPKADGLTHGMWLSLEQMLAGTRHEGLLRSAQDIVLPLRSVKTPSEIAAIQMAVEETLQLFCDVQGVAQRGMSERDIYLQIHAWMKERGLGFSWDPAGDPIVNSGPNSMIGHGIPSDSIRIEDGHIFHIDLGVICQGYASDLQRIWYVGEDVPEEVERAFEAVHASITAGAEKLRPGVQGWEVDAAARETLVSRGYPEYLHALGHQVGRVAHDGGTLLGPRWERYGNTPNLLVEAGHVYTLELGITVPGRGYLGLEEMVLVEETGLRWLAPRQDVVWKL
jgi:Xaa-Pro aminopeptidase